MTQTKLIKFRSIIQNYVLLNYLTNTVHLPQVCLIVNKRCFSRKYHFLRNQCTKFKSKIVLDNFLMYNTLYSYRNILFYHNVENKDIPHISVSQVKGFLTLQNINFVDSYTSLIIKCPICTSVKKGDLHINKVTGLVMCNGCKRSGQWDNLKLFLSKEKNTDSENNPLKKNSNESLNKWKELCSSSKPFSQISHETKSYLEMYFSLNTISEEILQNLNVHVNESSLQMYVPLKDLSNETVGYKEVKSNDEEDSAEPSHSCRGVIIYKTKTVKKDKGAVLVHNFKDFISLAHLSINYHIVCLPHGLTNLPQEILPILEKYKKIILWFGNDVNCWDAARQFAKKLGDERCFFVRPVEENPPAYIAVAENSDVKSILEKAEPVRHPSIIDFSFLREDILSEICNNDKAQGVKWQRFEGLNKLLKGHRRGELTILTGPTGSGKTTFLSEYSLDLLTQGVTTLWGSFEVRNQRLARTMLQQFVQLPLEENADKYNYIADCFERLPLYFMTFHGQQTLKIVLEAVEHATYVYDIAHVIIDNVQFMLGMLENESNTLDRFYRQDTLIGAFRNFATAHNCHVTLVIHPRKERDAEMLSISSIFGGAKATQEADNVMIIQQKMLQSLKMKKYLQIVKNRFSGDLGVLPLEFDRTTFCFSARTDRKIDSKTKPSAENDWNVNDLHRCQ